MRSGQPKVLILDGMWNKSLAAVRSFGRRGFHVAAGERTHLATALFSRYCSKRIIYPSPAEKTAAFLDCLEKELERGRYDAVFPMEWNSQALLTGPSNRQRFERYAKVPFADAGLAYMVNDKAQLMSYAAKCGIDIPRTYFVEGLANLEEIVDTLEFPVVIKPRISSGSRGLVYVSDVKELLLHYTVIHKRYPFPLIQECLPAAGEVYGVGLLLNSHSLVRASFVYKRIRSYPVAGGPSTFRESVKRADVLRIAGSLLQALKWTGIAHVEFKIDTRDGRPRLLEVNPRFWGSLQLAIEAGVDFPYLLYRMAMDGDIEPVRDYMEGVRCRWLIPGDLMHFLNNPDRWKMKPSFFDFRAKDDIISLQDPMPALGRVLSAFTLVFDKEMRALIRR